MVLRIHSLFFLWFKHLIIPRVRSSALYKYIWECKKNNNPSIDITQHTYTKVYTHIFRLSYNFFRASFFFREMRSIFCLGSFFSVFQNIRIMVFLYVDSMCVSECVCEVYMRSLMMGRTKTTTKIIQTKYLLDIRDEVIGIFPSGFIYFSWVYRIQLNIDNLRRSKKEPKNRTRSLLHFDILNKYTQTCLQGILV